LACFPAFRWRWRLTLLGSLAILVSALVVVSPLHRAKAEQTIASAATIIPGKPEWFNVWNQRLGTRLTLADAAVNMGLRNPAGVGASAFTEAYPAHTWPGDPQAQYVGKGVEINHAHHVWFQLLGEEGLSIKEAAERLRIPRGTLYEEIKRIRRIFDQQGLSNYLKD
jgi:hypothetical protein